MFAHWRNIAFALAFVVVIPLAGCGSQASPVASVDTEFVLILDNLIAQAKEADASSTQIESLARARKEGDVSLALLTDAVNATFACFDDAGIGHQLSTDKSQPLPLLTYLYESPESGNPVAEACIVRNSYFVEAAYQNQPRWHAQVTQRIKANRDAIVACLQELGIEISADATPDEIKQSTQISTEELHEYLDRGARAPVECLADFGAN